ncbi:hypothetical protein EDB83DRAFT_441416 [Lactarius deliciosus]|nr:hypothetical protein EDB83DRAFT_441416 [Lactarius deliciosus]
MLARSCRLHLSPHRHRPHQDFHLRRHRHRRPTASTTQTVSVAAYAPPTTVGSRFPTNLHTPASPARHDRLSLPSFSFLLRLFVLGIRKGHEPPPRPARFPNKHMLASLQLLLFLRGFGYRAGGDSGVIWVVVAAVGKAVGCETGTMRALLPCKNALPKQLVRYREHHRCAPAPVEDLGIGRCRRHVVVRCFVVAGTCAAPGSLFFLFFAGIGAA